MNNENRKIIDQETDDIVSFLQRGNKVLDELEIGYIKTVLSFCLNKGYLLALTESTKKVEAINF